MARDAVKDRSVRICARICVCVYMCKMYVLGEYTKNDAATRG